MLWMTQGTINSYFLTVSVLAYNTSTVRDKGKNYYTKKEGNKLSFGNLISISISTFPNSYPVPQSVAIVINMINSKKKNGMKYRNIFIYIYF